MSTFSDRLKEAMHARKIKASELSEKTGLSESLISQYVNGKFEAKNDKISILAKVLQVNEMWLAGFISKDESSALSEELQSVNKYLKPRVLSIPLYSELSCGQGIFVDDNIDEYIALPESLLHGGKEYFCQFAVGDSMIDENIVPGDLLVFEKTQHIENGQIGVFCIDDNIATCKKFYQDTASNIITLQPANSKYAPIIVTIESMSFHVVGKLSLVINKRD